MFSSFKTELHDSYQKDCKKISKIIQTSQTKTDLFLGLYSAAFGSAMVGMLPQYKYVARPLYKALGGKNNPLLAAPLTFLAMDYLFHQIPANIQNQKQLSSEVLCKIDVLSTLLWMSLCLPVLYYKYSQQEKLSPRITHEKIKSKDKCIKNNLEFFKREKPTKQSIYYKREKTKHRTKRNIFQPNCH